MNRTIEPAYSQPNKLEIQFPQTIELANGVELFWMNGVKDASVKLDIEWCAGSKYQKKKLTANFTNKLLLSGNESKSGAEIAEEIDYFGGFMQHEQDRDHAGITLYGLTENMGRIFSVFEEAFMTCTFPTKELEKERSIALMRFKIDAKKVKNTCSRKFTQAIFGQNSEYGQLAEESDFDKIEQVDLVKFYTDFYRTNNLTIFMVGNVDANFIEQLRNWTAKLMPKKNDFQPSNLNQEKGRIDIPVPNALQSAIRMGFCAMNKNHADYFQFQLLNTILGGYFGSRLMNNIREDKGYTYGIGSTTVVMEHAAYFYIATEVAAEVKDQTIFEINKELELLKTELISVEELARVKNYMLGDFLRHADGAIAMMENFKNIHFNKLKSTYYSDYIAAIHNATAEDLRNIANKYFRSEDWLLVTAG